MLKYLLLLILSTSAFVSLQCTEIKHRATNLTPPDNNNDTINFVWTNTISSMYYDNASCDGIAADGKGNIYVTGSFKETATFDAIKLKALGLRDVYIAKYDSNGNCVWATHAGSLNHNSQSSVYSITADAEGNIYITGRAFGSIVFDTILLDTPFKKANIFTAKYSPEGKCLWARLDLAGGYLFDQGKDIAVDTHGNSYVTGSFDIWANLDHFS